MAAKPMMILTILGSVACAGGGESRAHTAAAVPHAVAPPAVSVSEAPEPESPPAAALSEADRLYQSQLAASRGQFELERQITELRRAKLLYEQFLEHAGNRPELQPAVRKSRERIIDVQQTIDFLLGQQQTAESP